MISYKLDFCTLAIQVGGGKFGKFGKALGKVGGKLDWVGLVVYEGLVVGFEVVEFVGIVVVEVVGVVVVVGSMCLSVEIIL